MIKYRVAQQKVENPLLREGSYLTVYDKNNHSYKISLSASGDLQISTIDGELHVIPKCSNMINLTADGED